MADGGGFFGGLSSGFSEGQADRLAQQKQAALEQQNSQVQAQKQIDATIQHIADISKASAEAGQDPKALLQNPAIQTLVQSAQSLAQKIGQDPARVAATAQAVVMRPPLQDKGKFTVVKTGSSLEGDTYHKMNVNTGELSPIMAGAPGTAPAPNPNALPASDTLSPGQIATANAPARATPPGSNAARVAQGFADASNGGVPIGAPAQPASPAVQAAPTPTAPMTFKDAIAKNVTGDEFLKTLPDSLRGVVEGVANYQINPNSLSIKGGHREQILSLARQYSNHSYDQAFYPSRAQAIKEFTSGGVASPAGQITAGNTAIQHIGTVLDAYEGINKIPGLLQKIVDSDTPIASYAAKQLQNKAIRGTSEGQALAKFVDARERYVSEIERFYAGSQGADAAKQRSIATLDAALSPPEFHSAAGAEAELLSGKVNSLQDRWKTAMAGPKLFDATARKAIPDFPIIQEKSQKVLDKIRKFSTDEKTSSASGLPPPPPGFKVQ